MAPDAAESPFFQKQRAQGNIVVKGDILRHPRDAAADQCRPSQIRPRILHFQLRRYALYALLQTRQI